MVGVGGPGLLGRLEQSCCVRLPCFAVASIYLDLLIYLLCDYF